MLSKQVDPALFEAAPERWPRLAKAREWLDDHNPVPSDIRFWYGRTDWLHPSRQLRKARNVLRWLPVIWDDVDWDYSSLYRMVHVKIRHMRESHEKYHNHVGWEEVVDQMRTAEDCMGRLLRDEYGMKEFEEHEARFPRDRTLRKCEGGMYKSEPMTEESAEDFRRIMAAEDAQRRADLETFARMFVEHSQGWWD